MGERWKRPSNVPYPNTWAVVEGRKPLKNGKIPRFKIQDLTEDLVEDAIEHMKRNFCKDEPFCNYLGIAKDELALQEISEIWRAALTHKLGLIALLDNAEELDDPSLPRIAGCNMVFPIFPDDPTLEFKSNVNLIFVLMDKFTQSVNCFEKFNVPVIMYALGLSVDAIYRGQGLGGHILNSRIPLGKAVGIEISTTIFTAATSQKIAADEGYQVLKELFMEDYKENGKEVFPNIKTKSIQLSYRHLH